MIIGMVTVNIYDNSADDGGCSIVQRFDSAKVR